MINKKILGEKMSSVLSKKAKILVDVDSSAETRGFGVSASPFNGVKLELGIIFLLAIPLWLGADFIIASTGGQLLMLLGFGIMSSLWLVFRVRAVVRQCEAASPADS